MPSTADSLTITFGNDPTIGAAVPLAVVVELDGVTHLGTLAPEPPGLDLDAPLEPALDHDSQGIPVQPLPAGRWTN